MTGDPAAQPARVAIYFAPDPASRLWRLGCSCIGYDAETGREPAFPDDIPVDPATWALWTEEPRRYGFHATLKAPFGLAAGTSLDKVKDIAVRLSASLAPVRLPRLVVRSIGHFVALVPSERSIDLDRLAAACVEAFEPARAPLSEADRARRSSSPLTPRQTGHLARFGYPYVMEDFSFHMTLTGRIPPGEIERVRSWLDRLYAEQPLGVTIDTICLFAQDSREARFQIARRFPLIG